MPNPISIITAPARLGLRMAILPLRVARGVAGHVLGHDEDQDTFAPAERPPSRTDAQAPPPPPTSEVVELPDPEPPAPPRQPKPRRKPPARKRTTKPTRGAVAQMREQQREAEADAGDPGGDHPGPEIHVDAPWSDYDELDISDLLLRIEQATPAEKAIVRLYERNTKKREAVLHATG